MIEISNAGKSRLAALLSHVHNAYTREAGCKKNESRCVRKSRDERPCGS